MSSSSTVGKAWIRRQILVLDPKSIADVGPGRGTYHSLVGEALPNCYWIGIEVFEPYVQRYALLTKYDEVIISDAFYLDWTLVGPVDLVILGDVLEHFPRDRALRVWNEARGVSKHVVLSVPLDEYPQGPSAGNRFETHVSTWTKQECLALPGIIDHAEYSRIGVFLAKGLLTT